MAGEKEDLASRLAELHELYRKLAEFYGKNVPSLPPWFRDCVRKYAEELGLSASDLDPSAPPTRRLLVSLLYIVCKLGLNLEYVLTYMIGVLQTDFVLHEIKSLENLVSRLCGEDKPTVISREHLSEVYDFKIICNWREYYVEVTTKSLNEWLEKVKKYLRSEICEEGIYSKYLVYCEYPCDKITVIPAEKICKGNHSK